MNKLMLLSVAAVVVSGCATLQVKKDKVSALKKVAIVGYAGTVALDDGKPKNGLAGTIGAIKGSTDLMSGKMNARRIEQAEAGYAELSKRLATTFNMEVREHSTLNQSSTFVGVMEKTPTKGLFAIGLQHLPDVLRPEVINSAKPDVRAALASELGVDAIAAVKIRYEVGSTGGFAVAGMGRTTVYPRAVINFTVYDATGQEVWNDIYARGETAKGGLATTMGADIVSNESEVLAEALANGLDALLARYQAAP